MPETYGKRQRRNLREQKIAAKEERRVARTHRRELRAAGLLPPEEYVAPEDLEAAVDGAEEPSENGQPDEASEPEQESASDPDAS